MTEPSTSETTPPLLGETPNERPEAVELELFTHRFGAIAAEMGELLRRTALSTNVRDRLDFSCALLDPAGRLVVNAPHIPVHLGAMGLCVRRVREALELAPGDTVITNHPAYGGSHLPDVTVITPVFGPKDGDDASGELLGYVANRAHHAEIGGSRPGSMPPSASCLAEEGVVIEPTYLVRGPRGRKEDQDEQREERQEERQTENQTDNGAARWDALRRLLSAPPWPSRSVEENVADLHAGLAANRRGAAALESLASRVGREKVHRYMDALRRQGAEKLAVALGRLEPGTRRAEQRLDDGTRIRVAVTISTVSAEGSSGGPGRCRIDFTGTDSVHRGNLNATPAIVRSAVLYVLRLLVAEELPLNEGLFEPVELVLPPGTFLSPPFLEDDGERRTPVDPRRAPAVVGGNVETSQRLVDTLLLAFGLAASSQGTMNNLLFGNADFGYYETVCGGAGATAEHQGADAVHTHMTNTRITDPEILEQRYPVRLERFAIRRGSGGSGRWRGGDGVVRELRFLDDVELSILSQHRVEAPYGMDGGGAGATGRQRVIRASGEVEELAGMDQADLAAGDRLILETPGGGGWGTEE